MTIQDAAQFCENTPDPVRCNQDALDCKDAGGGEPGAMGNAKMFKCMRDKGYDVPAE